MPTVRHDLVIYTDLLLAVYSMGHVDIQTPNYTDVKNNESNIAINEVPRWNSSESPKVMILMSIDFAK